MAKIGQLCLNGGTWEGRRVVSSAWIEESTSPHSRWEAAGLSYGYLWWVLDPAGHVFAAMGDGGNLLYCDARKNTLVAVTCLLTKKPQDSVALIREHIEPML
jgi:CubicO group peptidase (beta-lactamase class C family)